MSKEELVELTISIPKPIMDFFEAYWQFVGDDNPAKQFLLKRLALNALELIRSLVLDEIVDFKEDIIEKYRLEPYKEAMGF